MWYGKTLDNFIYSSITIKDELIPHDKPIPHNDYYTFAIPYKIKFETLPHVLSLSKSVWYDRLTQTLYARCHFSGAQIATLYIATGISDGVVTETGDSLQNLYKKTIMMTMPSSDGLTIEEAMVNEKGMYNCLVARIRTNKKISPCQKKK